MRFVHRTLDRVDVPRVPIKVSADFRVAIVGLLVSIGCLIVASEGDPGKHASTHDRVLAYAGAGAFLIFGALTVRSIANEVNRITMARTGPSHAGIVRWLILLIGYIIVVLTALGQIEIKSLHTLLEGTAITGIVLGIAAQNSLGNLFAGLVLLLARPFNIGDRIRLRSGALGGEYIGVVSGMGLTYVTIVLADGAVSLPNSGVLSSAVGPAPIALDEHGKEQPPEVTYDPPTKPIKRIRKTAVKRLASPKS